MVKLIITTKGTATGYAKVSLPFTKSKITSFRNIIPLAELTTTGTSGFAYCEDGEAFMYLYKYDFTTPFIADADVWEGSGLFEIEYNP